MHELLGLDTTVLRVVDDRYQDEDREDQQLVYALENHTNTWALPPTAAWISAAALPDLALAVPAHRAVIAGWLTELASGLQTPLRVPWAYPGWYAQAVAWISEQLHLCHYHLRAPIEQWHIRVWSCVLRVPTTSGDLYFKAASQAFSYEPLLTASLAALWPAHCPAVLAVEVERAWMLLCDAGVPLRKHPLARDLATWERLLALFAHMQLDSLAHQERLLAAGCPDRRTTRIPALFSQLMLDRAAFYIGQPGGLNVQEYERLSAMSGEVAQLCTALASYGIPDALHHDDFHSANMAVQNERLLFFDWAESAVAHPFYTMIIVLRVAKYLLKYTEIECERLRVAYLAPWQALTASADLTRAFGLAQRLGLLCRALTWHQTLSHLETGEQWAFSTTVARNLRAFLYYPRDIWQEE